YRMVTGQAPFGGPTVSAQLLAVATETPTPACEVNLDVPRALSDLIDRLLAKDPADRPTGAEEVAEQLRPFEQEAERPTLAEVLRPRKTAPRRKLLAGALAAVVLLG